MGKLHFECEPGLACFGHHTLNKKQIRHKENEQAELRLTKKGIACSHFGAKFIERIARF